MNAGELERCPRCGIRHAAGACMYDLTVDGAPYGATAGARCPHGRTVASRLDNPCPPGLIACYVPLPAAHRLLLSLEASLASARVAIADEAEGKLRAAAFEIHNDAAELLAEIRSW